MSYLKKLGGDQRAISGPAGLASWGCVREQEYGPHLRASTARSIGYDFVSETVEVRRRSIKED